MIAHHGGCHCGRVRFEVIAPSRIAVAECNCSMCSKVGYLHLIVPKSRFRLLQGEEFLTTYTFNTRMAKHFFCSVCGVKSFYVPRSHPEGYSVNVRCLDAGTVEALTIESFNGLEWEKQYPEGRGELPDASRPTFTKAGGDMSATPQAVARDWFEQVWNSGSAAAIDRLLAVDARMHGLPTPDGKPLIGPSAFKPFWRKFRSAFPDIRIDVARTVTEGEYIAVHCHVTGKHLGDGLEIAATRRPIDLWGMGIARIQNGQVVEGWNCFDFMSLYQQVGLLPAVGAVAQS